MHAGAIARHLKPADFIEDALLLNVDYRNEIIDQAVSLARTGFTSISLLKSDLSGKDVYQLTDMSQRLVVRHITRNIRRLTGVKQDNREFIIQCITRFLEEGTRYRIYKFDVKSFYESVCSEKIVSTLASDEGFSGQSASVLQSLFIELNKAGVSGLPRGFGLSATLAEFLLRPFDQRLSEMKHVWFYARFVDDIFIITDGNEVQQNFVGRVSDFLPDGLEFNQKSSVMDFEGFKKGVSGAAHTFDFLGYQFSVSKPYRRSDDKIGRKVELDIAPKKVRKIKTRVAISLVKFASDGNFTDLHARIRLLTSNFNFVDRRTAVRRVAGIYYNYPLIDAEGSTALRQLDVFLRNVLTSPHPKNRLRPVLSPPQRAALVRLTFSAGFRRKRFFNFSPVRLAALTSCWSYA